MRVFVFGLITAGSFMMLSADTRGVDLPSAEWCSTGTLVPVAEFRFYPEAFQGLRTPDFKMVGQFDDDYDTNPREDDEEEAEVEQVRTALAMASTHCEQFTLAKRGAGDRGQVIAVAEWPQTLIKSDAGRYSLSQGAAGVCLRCQ